MSLFYNCFHRIFGDGGFEGPEPPDGGCDDCGGGCTGEGCGCTDCDPGDDSCDDLVMLATCPEGNVGPCIERVYTKQTLVDRNCIVDCEDPVLPDCESCDLGFLPQDCEQCCPEPPPPNVCQGYYCTTPNCTISYTDGGCVSFFSYTIPANQTCPETYLGNRVYPTYQQALVMETCYDVESPNPNNPGTPGGGGGGGSGTPPRPISGEEICTLHKCVITSDPVFSTPGALAITKECVAESMKASQWAARFNITATLISCDIVKSRAVANGYFPSLADCEAECQDEFIEPQPGGGGGVSTNVYVCLTPNSGGCQQIEVATANIGNDGKLITTGQQTYETEDLCTASSECCEQQEIRYWRCDLTNNCECVDDVVVYTCLDSTSPPAGAYTTKAACENQSDCCKDDVAGAVQTLASLYPFNSQGGAIGPKANVCPDDSLTIQPTDFATLQELGNDYDLSFESSDPIAITFDESSGDISVDPSVWAIPNWQLFSFFKMGVARECCGGGNPTTIDVLLGDLVNVLDRTDSQCSRGGGVDPGTGEPIG